MNVELRDEARADLVEGAFFYSKQAESLDEYFLNSTEPEIQSEHQAVISLLNRGLAQRPG